MSMDSAQLQRAENLLSMDIRSMRFRTYLFAVVAALTGLGFLFANYLTIAIAEFSFAFLLMAVRLRYLSMVELIQDYIQEKFGSAEVEGSS